MLYDGQNMIAERGTLTADFLFGPGIDEPLAMVRGTTQYYFVTDALGSVSLVNDSAGAIQDSYIFDSWGTNRAQSILVSNPFTYTSHESADAGLLYYRARHYQPGIGKFISEDPLQLAASFAHLPINFPSYNYSNNSPASGRDPFGLFTISECNRVLIGGTLVCITTFVACDFFLRVSPWICLGVAAICEGVVLYYTIKCKDEGGLACGGRGPGGFGGGGGPGGPAGPGGPPPRPS